MFADLLKKLIRKEDLSSEEASRAMTAIMTGEAGEARTAAFLTALSIKGETGAEIEAFARAMRHAAVKWPGARPEILLDTCGTGGDGTHTINISTLAAIVLAAQDLPVAKHGNRAVSSTTGSADILEALGMSLSLDHDRVAQSLDRYKITFLFAPQWHPAMKHAAPVRKALGIRTVFNLLGPLTNPAPITHQVVGVFDPAFMPPVAQALAGLRRKGAYVIHSDDGMDEVSPATTTRFIKVESGQVADEGSLAPADFGFEPVNREALVIQDREECLRRTRDILAGQGSKAENQTIAMNAGLIYSIAKGIPDIKEATGICLETITSGKMGEQAQRWHTA